MSIIYGILWLSSTALSILAGYAHFAGSMDLLLFLFIPLACLFCISMLSLLIAPLRYRVGSRYFRHPPATTIIITLLGVMTPYAAGGLLLTLAWLSGQSSLSLAILWCTVGAICNIYASVTAVRAAYAL